MQHHDYEAAKLEDPYDHICATTSSASASASVNTRRTSKHGTANRALFTAHNTHLKKVFQEFSPALLSCLNANPFAHKTKHWSCQGQQILITNKPCLCSMLVLSWVPVQHSNSPPEMLRFSTPTISSFFPIFRQVAKLMATSGALEQRHIWPKRELFCQVFFTAVSVGVFWAPFLRFQPTNEFSVERSSIEKRKTLGNCGGTIAHGLLRSVKLCSFDNQGTARKAKLL